MSMDIDYQNMTEEQAIATAAERNAEHRKQVLDCGHTHPETCKPLAYTAKHLLGRWTVSDMGGAATTPEGERICGPCATKREQEDFAKEQDRWSGAYLSDGKLTTWLGGELATVTEQWDSRISPSCDGVRFRAVDAQGRRWYGTSPGDGSYALMHRAK